MIDLLEFILIAVVRAFQIAFLFIWAVLLLMILTVVGYHLVNFIKTFI